VTQKIVRPFEKSGSPSPTRLPSRAVKRSSSPPAVTVVHERVDLRYVSASPPARGRIHQAPAQMRVAAAGGSERRDRLFVPLVFAGQSDGGRIVWNVSYRVPA